MERPNSVSRGLFSSSWGREEERWLETKRKNSTAWRWKMMWMINWLAQVFFSYSERASKQFIKQNSVPNLLNVGFKWLEKHVDSCDKYHAYWNWVFCIFFFNSSFGFLGKNISLLLAVHFRPLKQSVVLQLAYMNEKRSNTATLNVMASWRFIFFQTPVIDVQLTVWYQEMK